MPPYPDSAELARIDSWLRGRGFGTLPIEDAKLVHGGTQNILLRFRKSGRQMIMRRPPLHPRPNSSETMRREARLLAALAGSAIPHPAMIDQCNDENVIGVAFYLMEAVEGFTAPNGMPSVHRDDPAIRRAMGFAMVDGAAALGSIDLLATGLTDFGRPDGFLERQTPRWLTLLESYREFGQWPGPDDLGPIGTIVDWLNRKRPASFVPGIMHGDFHIGNMMFDVSSAKLAAIVDWELATIGDPLLDLGWMLATWPDASFPDGPVGALRVEPSSGFPSLAELVARYASSSSRSLESVGWYAVLACFKLAIILEGTHARASAGKADPAMGERLHQSAKNLLRRAVAWTSNCNSLPWETP